jgi:HPt (histidine-containing phosphotransfer) domain-containing protein
MSNATNGLTTAVLDRDQIDLLCSLDDGAGELLEEVIGEFFLVSDDLRAQLLAAVGDADVPVAQRAAHTLKGASANVGAARLAQVCAEFDALAPGTNASEASALVERFDAEYVSAVGALRTLSARG